MGERAKVMINEFTALELLKRNDLNLDNFYTSDLKIMINAAKKEIKRLNLREKECIDKYLAESKYRGEIEGKYVVDEYIINEFEKTIENNKKEIERLNNIMVELKKYVNDNMQYYDDGEDCGVDCCIDGFEILKIIERR